MKCWPDELRCQWFAVARGDRVGKKPIAVTLLDVPIVLARLDGKRVVGFEDRCPHRGVPLSAGHVVQGSLQCLYHGWLGLSP